MKPIIISILIGATVAGLIYYFKDDKKAKKVVDKLSRSAKEELKNVNWTKVGTQALGAVAEEVHQSNTGMSH